MKAFYFLMSIILLFVGCTKKSNKEITLIGYLKDADTKEISLTSDTILYKALVDSGGSFILKFICEQPRIYQLKTTDKLDLFLIPGDTVTIKREGKDYTFSGGQSAVLSQYYKDWEKNYWNGDFFDDIKFYSLEPEEFLETAYALLDNSKMLFNKMEKELNPINPEFVRLEKERLKYDMFRYIQAYAYQMHKYHTGKEPVINESFYNYMENVNLNDSSLLQIEYYRSFLSNYIYYTSKRKYQSSPEILKDKYSLTNVILNSISQNIKNQKIRDYVSYDLIIGQARVLQLNDNNMAMFKELCNNQDYIKEVENVYNDFKDIMPGNIAPDFALYDANNKEYRLSDFEGKYLFIDVWGAFCVPCKKEAPHLNQIENDYKGKNIEFIGICLEKNREIWLKRIKEYNLHGIQLTAKGDWNSQFRKDYKIPWVPTYILIDKEGKIVDARAPNPSEDLCVLLNETIENKK